MTFEERDFPEGVMYARIDQLTTYQDYPPYDLCLRLIGVDKASFENAAFNDAAGCRTYLMDINLRQDSGSAAVRNWIPLSDGNDWSIDHDLSISLGKAKHQRWLRVEFNHSHVTLDSSYGYALFQGAAPTYLTIHAITPVQGREIQPVLQPQPALVTKEQAPSPPKALIAFHVGQGMCSVVQCDGKSYLLDAGAGTPVKREAYGCGQHGHGNAFKSDLLPALGQEVDMVLSHPDSDHWRLLDWEPALLQKIKTIYVPDNVADLVFSDPAIRSRLVPVTWLQVRDPAGQVFLESHRSRPIHSDSNGQCLVSEAMVEGRIALLPGDYVYERIATDTNAAVAALAQKAYDAVVVPHHGDRHSAHAVVAPMCPNQSIAFFSAGNHLGYHHPRAESLTSHHNAHFHVVSRKWLDDIVAAQLL